MVGGILARFAYLLGLTTGSNRLFAIGNGSIVEMPFLRYKSKQMLAPSNTTTGGTPFGINLSHSGTISHPTPAATSIGDSIRRMRWSSTGTAGNAAGMVESALTKVRGDVAGVGGFHAEIVFIAGSNVTGHQCFVGLQGGTAVIAGDPSSLANIIGMGYDAADSAGGNWQFFTNDASGTASKYDLPLAPRNPNNLYRLTIDAASNGSGVDVKVEDLSAGVTVHTTTYTTDIPAATQYLGVRANIRTGTTTTIAAIEVASVDIGYQE